MDRSSGQNSPKNCDDSQAQILPEEETQENDPVASEGPPENPTEASEGTESRVAPADESHASASNIQQNITDSETVPLESAETTTEGAVSARASPRTVPVVLTFAARDRPRQPFFGTTPTPASTSTGVTAPSPRQPPGGRAVQIQLPQNLYSNRTTPQTQQPEVQEQPQGARKEHQYVFSDNMNPFLNPMVNPFTNVVTWAPYPTKIDPDIPPYLAHLVGAEVVFVVQHLEAIEFFANLDLPNIYFIQNDKGESIYYVYESTMCIPCCCKNSRALQLHVMDMYQNEVIFMRKSCGCALYFCCFPLLEIYSPPSDPIGAIVKECNIRREQFSILDADENLLFKIYGDCSCMYCSRCMQYDFTIRALDANETEVGYIRRDFPGMYQFFMGTEYYGVSFPANMDVRMKAVFLGALFLIEFLYFE